MSGLVCEAERQNRTRDVIRGVALRVTERQRGSRSARVEDYSRVGNDDDDQRRLVSSDAT
jgi:hypothetical protein